jgi:hypothetical protein
MQPQTGLEQTGLAYLPKSRRRGVGADLGGRLHRTGGRRGFCRCSAWPLEIVFLCKSRRRGVGAAGSGL